VRKFIDEDDVSLTFFPISTSKLAIGFGGIVITKCEYDIVNNKFVRMNAEFIGKNIVYQNKVKSEDLTL